MGVAPCNICRLIVNQPFKVLANAELCGLDAGMDQAGLETDFNPGNSTGFFRHLVNLRRVANTLGIIKLSWEAGLSRWSHEPGDRPAPCPNTLQGDPHNMLKSNSVTKPPVVQEPP